MNTEKWEKEFDMTFVSDAGPGKGLLTDITRPENIKDYIRSLLTAQLEEMEQEVEWMKKNGGESWTQAWDDALDAVTELLQKHKQVIE